jgi:hypothetical protein
MKKVHDLAVKTGSYADKQGDIKNRYENIGSIMENDDGGRFMFLKRSFNPAGVPFKEGSTDIIVSMFDPKPRDGAGNQAQAADQAPPLTDEDIPF